MTRRWWIASITAMLLAVLTGPAWSCENGETRCGADGYVQVCSINAWNTRYGTKCANSGGDAGSSRPQPQQALACNFGDTKCGADGNVYRCTSLRDTSGILAPDPNNPRDGTTWRQAFGKQCSPDRDRPDNAPQR